jgi:drug/metabolite transporter (DMT)-like permease
MIRRDEAVIYTVELAATTAFAIILNKLDRKYEPDWTWLVVMIGVIISAAPSMILARRDPTTTWEDYERRALAGFCTSGLIIIAWQLFQYAERRGSWNGYELARLILENRYADPTPPLEHQA